MALVSRLLRITEPRIPIRWFFSAVGEHEIGRLSRADLIALFNVAPDEEATLDALLTKIVTPRESICLGNFVLLTNVGTTFDATAVGRGCGLVRIECAGINAIEFAVRYDKPNAGTLGFQLWDETASSEVLLLEDTTGTTGTNRSLVNTRTFAQPLAPGIRTIRVRPRSATSADDPVYLGGSLLVQRVANLNPNAIERIVMLADARLQQGQYADAAAAIADITDRLGLA